MRPPRWFTALLLAAAALVSASWAIAAWLDWPNRTIRAFTRLVEQGRFDEANLLLRPPIRWRPVPNERDLQVLADGPTRRFQFPSNVWQRWCTVDNLQLESRSLADLAAGRRKFAYHQQFTTPFFIGGFAERGTVVLQCEPWAVQP